jgi:hypothetical protein|tara:strand:+ start:519 stop:962 length:444 start_codon:yes stop_codon:yes gene_type:complete
MPLDNPRFTESYKRLLGQGTGRDRDAGAYFTRFCEIFLRYPGVADLFADTEVHQQVQILKKSSFHPVTFGLLNKPTPELERLGSTHAISAFPWRCSTTGWRHCWKRLRNTILITARRPACLVLGAGARYQIREIGSAATQARLAPST